MGSWDETCGISQLPISPGDKVRLFILRGGGPKRREGGGICYPNDMWSPIAPPIAGEYADYGEIGSIVEGEASEFLLEQIKRNWAPIDEEKHREKNVPAEKLDLETALNLIERSACDGLSDYQGDKEHLGMMFVLEDVYQACINYSPIETSFYKESYVYKPYLEILNEEMKEWYDKCFEKLEECKYDDEELRFQKSFGVNLIESRLFWNMRGKAGHANKRKLVDLMLKGYDYEHPKSQEFIKLVKDLFAFENMMKDARKMWTPQCGKGSQQNDLAVYKMLNEATNKFMEKKDAEMQEDVTDDCIPDAEGYTPWMREHNAKVLKS